jgi:3-hydroxyisobutyrate dehydrogenase
MEGYKSIGFIGLGLMGVPMVENVIKKTSSDIRIYVNDVVEDAVKQLCEQYPDRVEKCDTAKDIAEKSVCKISFKSCPLLV